MSMLRQRVNLMIQSLRLNKVKYKSAGACNMGIMMVGARS